MKYWSGSAVGQTTLSGFVHCCAHFFLPHLLFLCLHLLYFIPKSVFHLQFLQRPWSACLFSILQYFLLSVGLPPLPPADQCDICNLPLYNVCGCVIVQAVLCMHFQAFAALLMRSFLIWVDSQHVLLVVYQCLGVAWTTCPLKVGSIGCPELLVNCYRCMLCDSAEEWRRGFLITDDVTDISLTVLQSSLSFPFVT